ncbi:MAG: non-heme iron oxygenase ferredoxin subunit [Steroidobacteraceae bacterium]|nr:non-heme iron oxygenase ferredoxin subunit [Steroidobacteraceae bacterium]
MAEESFKAAMPVAELAPGRMRSCRIGEHEIVVCHTREGVFALDNVCTHAFARLSEGYFRGTRITCPLHGAVFDVRDGRVLGGPATTALPTHPTRIVDGVIEVALSSPDAS